MRHFKNKSSFLRACLWIFACVAFIGITTITSAEPITNEEKWAVINKIEECIRERLIHLDR